LKDVDSALVRRS